MFDHLVKENNLEPVMKQHGLVLPEDLDFIKEQIAGPLNNGSATVPFAPHIVGGGYSLFSWLLVAAFGPGGKERVEKHALAEPRVDL